MISERKFDCQAYQDQILWEKRRLFISEKSQFIRSTLNILIYVKRVCLSQNKTLDLHFFLYLILQKEVFGIGFAYSLAR